MNLLINHLFPCKHYSVSCININDQKLAYSNDYKESLFIRSYLQLGFQKDIIQFKLLVLEGATYGLKVLEGARERILRSRVYLVVLSCKYQHCIITSE